MCRRGRILLMLSLAYGSLVQKEANASTDLPAQYDARAVAMGGTGTSYVENGSSVFLNPATLDGVRAFAGTAVISPLGPTLTTPVTGPDSSVKSSTTYFPLFLAGAAYRLSDRVVVGFAVYPTSGFGASYLKVGGGGDVTLSIAQIEASPALSVELVRGLSVGLGYRITYTRESSDFPAGAGSPSASQSTLTGTNFFGVHAGVYYRPTETLHLGLTYRSQVTSSLSGTTDTGGGSFDTRQNYASPQRFKLGASCALLEGKLLLATDVKYLLFSASHKSLDTTIVTPMGSVSTSQPLDWKNVLAFGAGAEYWASTRLAVRGGYSLSQSATPDRAASIFSPPPGLLHGLHAGAGMKLTGVDLDLGGFYTFGSRHLAADPGAPAVAPGDYDMTSLMFSLSGTYRL
jgi:long-subunit fatty acid transport protein